MADVSNTTIPATLRRKVMDRAWELFRRNYGYPRVPFRSIGKHCFAYCLRMAWAEARETVRLAAIGVERLKAAMDALVGPAHATGLATRYASSYNALADRARESAVYGRALDFALTA